VPILFAVYIPALLVTAAISASLVRNPATRYVGIARGALAFATAPGMRLFLSAVTRPGGASQ